jgi:hypothetical protein
MTLEPASEGAGPPDAFTKSLRYIPHSCPECIIYTDSIAHLHIMNISR